MRAPSHESDILLRIQTALDAATAILRGYTPGNIKVDYKPGRHVVTEADHAVNDVLLKSLGRNGEGWLSEETTDDVTRLNQNSVWIVDPIDGTKEFVRGISEWCVSVALVEDGIPIAGGICNPATDELFLGSLHTGLQYNGNPARSSQRAELKGSLILSSRSETNRGEWQALQNGAFTVQPIGSIAYKLARVAAGLADATWTFVPKHEWDVAAGVALVQAGGGIVRGVDDRPLEFNNRKPVVPGLIACGPGLYGEITALLRSGRAKHAELLPTE